ncbi:hypothetical protein ABW21_db0200098 [Orbilia brochopaga]|nr:hypothetical protein ABW21_db0200098 [Drechslerella brochopaga]
MQPAKKIPQFKSFKSAPKPESSTEDSESRKPASRDKSSERHRHRHGRDRDRDRDRDSHRARDSHRRRDRSSDRGHRRRSRSKSPRSRDTVLTHPAQDPTILPWDAPTQTFQIDTKGDPHNITYGTIHRYNIPKYSRYGSRIVGLPRAVKIESDKGDGKGVVTGRVSRGDARVRGWDYALEHSRPLRVKLAGDDDDDSKGFVEGWNYVELSGARKRKRVEETDTRELDYRSIEGVRNMTISTNTDEDLEEIPSSDDEPSAFDADIKDRTIRLSRLVDAQPHNIDAWFALMEHQEIIVYGNKERRHRRKVRQGERQALEEVKLGILDKALTHNDGHPRILLTYMDIAAGIWDASKLKAKWEDVLSKHATTIELWEAYINFRQTEFTSFKYRECLAVYESCVAKLRGRALQYGATEDSKASLEEILLYILTRMTVYMRQAGFSELSLAIWQALLEMNSSLPKEFSTSPASLTDHERMLDLFGAFWDSEVLRIGEAKAKGWAVYADDDVGDFADPKDLPDDYDPSTDDLRTDDPDFFGAWLDKEAALQGRLPARTTDEVEEDDPFRVILFTDIREFLWLFQTSAARSKLGDAFLAFAGILAPTAFQNDAFLRADLASASDSSLASWFWGGADDNVQLITWVDGQPMDSERRGRVARHPFLFRSPHLPFAPATLVSSAWWFDSVEVPVMATDECMNLCIAMLRDYVLRVPNERLALIYFAVEVKRQAAGKTDVNYKKVAKALLKRYSTSLRLWNAYAISESAQGNREAAGTIYTTALKMAPSFSEEQRRRTVELWLSWTWSHLDKGDEDAALDMLLAIPDGYEAVGKREKGKGPVVGAGVVLRAMRYFEEQQQMHAREEGAVACTELRCLLLYLTAGSERAPMAFLKPLDELITDIQSQTHTVDVGAGMSDNLRMLEEHAMMAKARLLYRYAAHARPYKAATFRVFLEDAIARFPQNTAFLSLFVWNEARSKIEYRIRRMLAGDNDDGTGKQEGGVVRWVFRVWAELQMGGSANGSAVRSVFERALENGR